MRDSLCTEGGRLVASLATYADARKTRPRAPPPTRARVPHLDVDADQQAASRKLQGSVCVPAAFLWLAHLLAQRHFILLGGREQTGCRLR